MVELCIAGKRFLLDECSLPADKGAAIAAAIQGGTARAVCDGSFNAALDSAGTSAFIIAASSTDRKMIKGTNWITGWAADQTSFRSELGGIIGVLTVIEMVVTFWKITAGRLTIKLDNESAVDKAMD